MPLPIETSRLLIRPFTAEDAGPLHETIFADPKVMRYLPRRFASDRVDRTARRLGRWIGHQERHGFGWWAIEERGASRLIGMTGLFLLDFTGPDVELIVLLGRDWWGRGYATEAARACLEFGFRQLGLRRIVAFVAPENAASIRVLEKLGMRSEGMGRYLDEDVLVYSAEAALS